MRASPTRPRLEGPYGAAMFERTLRNLWRAVVADRARTLAAVAAAAIAVGGVLHLLGAGAAGDRVWGAAVALLVAELAYEVARTIVVDHHLGVDTIALVAMV